LAKPAAVYTSRQTTCIALLVAITFFMENLDATVIATALPQMASDFGESAVSLNIGISAYLLAVAVFIPGGASIGPATRRPDRHALVVALDLLPEHPPRVAGHCGGLGADSECAVR